MVNKNNKNREENIYYYIRQVMLLNILITLKAPQISYNIDHIFS